MIFDQIKAFCPTILRITKAGSFIFFLSFTLSLSAAEVSRSLSLEDRVRILEQQLSSQS